MAHLLSLPENVLLQHLLPHLNHNDILRLRRVSKQTKVLAETYLWTPTSRHQGKWELEIDPNKEGHSLKAFLGSGLPPPPSRLRIAHKFVNDEGHVHLCPSCTCRSFFEDDYLEEFMERYSKYVTHLSVVMLQLPLTSNEEIRFYKSLVNLENLRVGEIKTVGGAAQFEEKTRNAHGGFLIKPTFQKLKKLNLTSTDCMDSMWNFINGVSDNLDVIAHPFKPENDDSDDRDADDDSVSNTRNLAQVRALIERRRLRNQSTLLYDWGGMHEIILQPSELLPLLALCRDNGVLIKNFMADFLDFLLHDEDGWLMGENYRGNLFVGNILHSLKELHDNVFLMELPALVKLEIHSTASNGFRLWEGRASPEWPSLKKLCVTVDSDAVDLLHFLSGYPQLRRTKLEELQLNWRGINARRKNSLPLPCPRNLALNCGNLKKLALVNCRGDNNFFLGLWEGLPLLEEIYLSDCPKLTSKGFIGNGRRGSVPVFLNLRNLKRFDFHDLKARTRITDATFKKVFRHLKISSFHLCSGEPLGLITLAGIKELLSGQFAENIEKLDLEGLVLRDVSSLELMQVVSLFRCSKML